MDVGRVVDDKGAVPHHGEVDGQVADVGALVVVLWREQETRHRDAFDLTCMATRP